MLERTLDTALPPGSNPRGDYSGSNWLFLLPTLELGRVGCVGPVPDVLLRVIHGLATQVVMSADPTTLEPGTVDLVLVSGRANPAAVRTAAAALEDRGVLWLADPRALPSSLADELSEHYQLGPAPAAPSPDRQSILWLPVRRRAPGVLSLQARRVRRVAGRLVARPPFRRPSSPGREPAAQLGDELGGLEALVPTRPPPSGHAALLLLEDRPLAWLHDVAAQAGVALDGWRWQLARRADYATQKLLFFLYPPTAGRPELVAKVTRLPRFNHRLENEVQALRRLAAVPEAASAVPTVVFDDWPGGVAVAGESMLDGVPFRAVTTGRTDCPHVRRVLEWLTALAAATRDTSVVAHDEVVARLGELVARFVDVYRPDPALGAFLSEQVAVVREGPALPTVFTHGDPGNWNLLVDEAGDLAVLDWENAEPAGVPLWDVFYFVQTFGVWMATAQRRRYTPRTYQRQLLDEGDLSRLLVEWVGKYCAAVDVPASHVTPLFHLCWVQYALREAARLPPDRLGRGRYLRLLRRHVAWPEAAGLRALTRVSGAAR